MDDARDRADRAVDAFVARYSEIFRNLVRDARDHPGFWREAADVQAATREARYTTSGAVVREWPRTREAGVGTPAVETRSVGVQTDAAEGSAPGVASRPTAAAMPGRAGPPADRRPAMAAAGWEEPLPAQGRSRDPDRRAFGTAAVSPTGRIRSVGANGGEPAPEEPRRGSQRTLRRRRLRQYWARCWACGERGHGEVDCPHAGKDDRERSPNSWGRRTEDEPPEAEEHASRPETEEEEPPETGEDSFEPEPAGTESQPIPEEREAAFPRGRARPAFGARCPQCGRSGPGDRIVRGRGVGIEGHCRCCGRLADLRERLLARGRGATRG